MSDHRHGHGPEKASADRLGARQPQRFDPKRAPILDDRGRLEYLPPDEIFPLLSAPEGGRVVDFGTGTGLFAFELARRRPDLEIIALDEQREMLARLASNPATAQSRRIVPTHSSELPGLRGTADAVLAVNVLHELGDEATGQMVGLLKPGGRLVAVDWNGAMDRPVGPPPHHVYTPAEGRSRLEHFGLEVREQAPLKYHYVLVGRARKSAHSRQAT